VQTVKGAIAEFSEYRKKTRPLSAFRKENCYLREFESYFQQLKTENLTDISPKLVDGLMAALQSKKKQNSSINRQFTLYKVFFKKCMEWGWLDDSPARFIKKLREIEPVRVLWSTKQFKIILKFVPYWLRQVLRFLRATGVRPQELSEIQRKHVDLEGDIVRLYDPKTGAVRIVALNLKAKRVLLIQLAKTKDKDDYVFTTERNKKITTHRINEQLRRSAKKYGVTRETAYALRHGYATNLSRKNVNLAKIQRAMGHKKISTTLKYTHLDLEDLRECAKIKY
jgi:site-specific recombinase XerD